MKKFIANVLIVIYSMFFFVASGMASELYYVQNANRGSVLSSVQNTFKSNGYTIKNNDPVYGVKSNSDAVVILQQSQNDLYYYNSSYDSNLNKNILSSMRQMGLSYKKIRNDTMSLSFARTANELKKNVIANSNQAKVYNFDSSEITLGSNVPSNKTYSRTSSEDSLRGYVGQIPVGTTFDVYLQTTVNTASAQKGDQVTAVLTKNWVYNGKIIAEQGSTVTGVVTKAHSSGMAYRNGYVKITFNKLTTVDGKEYNIATEEIEFKVDSDGRAADAAGKIVAGVAIGAIAGLLIGALSGDMSVGKTTAISAGTGAVLGMGAAAMEQGSDAEIPTYTEMTLKLTAPLNVVLSY